MHPPAVYLIVLLFSFSCPHPVLHCKNVLQIADMIAHHLKHRNRVFYLFLLTSLLLHGSVSTVLFWLAPHTAPHAESPAVIMVSLASPLQQKSNSSPATLSAPVTPSVVPKSNTASPSVATKPASTPVTFVCSSDVPSWATNGMSQMSIKLVTIALFLACEVA